MAGKQQRSWLIVYTEEAVVDLADVKAREERKALFNVVHKLKELGPALPTPHMKSLKGEADLFELRPKQGRSAVRPITPVLS
ncbi:MAG TPA: type II toxin-antitoxin system RelE/ParE family toxin, partial [Thermoleophilaceae bacterium]